MHKNDPSRTRYALWGFLVVLGALTLLYLSACAPEVYTGSYPWLNVEQNKAMRQAIVEHPELAPWYEQYLRQGCARKPDLCQGVLSQQ